MFENVFFVFLELFVKLNFQRFCNFHKDFFSEIFEYFFFEISILFFEISTDFFHGLPKILFLNLLKDFKF